jgi:DNA-binding MarR family transcriptional regulator
MPSFYAIIPANVRYDKELPANAKLLYGEITALCNEKGFCWATNGYFAELYDVAPETVSRWISKLEQKGYISMEHIESEGNTRKIWIFTPLDEKIKTSKQKDQEGLDEKIKQNTTVNTTNNKREGELELPFKSEAFKEKWEEWLKYRKERKTPSYKPTGLKHTFKKIQTLSQNNEIAAIKILEQSMGNGWQGLFPLKETIQMVVTKDSKLTYQQNLENQRQAFTPIVE